jgi:hypothetical protein
MMNFFDAARQRSCRPLFSKVLIPLRAPTKVGEHSALVLTFRGKAGGKQGKRANFAANKFAAQILRRGIKPQKGYALNEN